MWLYIIVKTARKIMAKAKPRKSHLVKIYSKDVIWNESRQIEFANLFSTKKYFPDVSIVELLAEAFT